MPRRGENIYKRKDGRWEGRYVIGKKENGKTAFASVYGKKYTEVKRILEERKSNRNACKDTSSQVKKFRDGSVEAWLEYWLEEEVKPEVKQSTYMAYRGQIERHLVPAAGKGQLSEVNGQTIERVYSCILKKGLSAVTTANVCKRFLAALNRAHSANLISTLPVMPYRKKKAARRKPRFLGIQEQKLIEKNLDERKPKDLGVLLSLYSGCRIGECCALKWEDFDLPAGGIHVTHTLQRVPSFHQEAQKTALLYTTPKSESSDRFIPLPMFLVKALGWLKKAREPKETDFIFGKGSKPAEPRVLQYFLSNLARSLNIKGMHFHTLRHTFAARFMEKNKDVQTLKEILGHSSAKITMDWYGHTTEAFARKSMRRLTRLAS